MKLSTAFYNATYGTANAIAIGIVNTFNFLSGTNALRKEGLKFGTQLGGQADVLFMSGSTLGMVTAVVSAVSGILPIGLAVVAAIEVAFLPAQLTAAYKIGKKHAKAPLP